MMRMRENDVNSGGGFGDNTEMRNVHSFDQKDRWVRHTCLQ